MSDEVLMQLSSNSNPSDPSLPTKLAKLEARMAGKATPSAPTPPPSSPWQSSASSVRFGPPEELPVASTSSDSDNDIGGEFLIQANTQKRQRIHEDVQATTSQPSEGADVRIKITETTDLRPGIDDSNKSKQGRGRGRSGTGRGRGSKSNDHARPSNIPSAAPLANGHLESVLHKENWAKEQFGSDEKTSLQEEIILLRGKVSSLEEELCKSRQEATSHQQLCRQLELELKDFKERDQQMKIKRIKVLSDLLIAVSKAERQVSDILTQVENFMESQACDTARRLGVSDHGVDKGLKNSMLLIKRRWLADMARKAKADVAEKFKSEGS